MGLLDHIVVNLLMVVLVDVLPVINILLYMEDMIQVPAISNFSLERIFLLLSIVVVEPFHQISDYLAYWDSMIVLPKDASSTTSESNEFPLFESPS